MVKDDGGLQHRGQKLLPRSHLQLWCISKYPSTNEFDFMCSISGTTSYKQGTGLQEFAITVHDPLSTLEAAATLGYASINHTIVGPDGYRIKLLRTEKDRSEPFQHVTLRVRDLSVSTHFYTAMLGMHSDPRIYMLPPQQYRVFSYHDQDTAQQGCDRGGAVQTEQVPIVLLQVSE